MKIQWLNEKGEKYEQWSTKQYTENLRSKSSCSTSGTVVLFWLQIGGKSWMKRKGLWLPSPKFTIRYTWNIVESGIKHHNLNPNS